MIQLIALRELRSLFVQPSSWLVLAALHFVLAWFFLSNVEVFLAKQAELAQINNPPGVTVMIAAPTFQLLALLLMLLTPIFTMRLLAEEKRNQSFPLLLSAPINDWQIVLGKFLGLNLFFCLLILSSILMVYSLALGTSPDHGLIASNIIGLLLLSCSFISAGLYISALTNQPIIAALGALALLLSLWLIDMSSTSDTPWHLLSPLHHFQSFNAGSLSSNSFAFFILFSLSFLLLTLRRLRNNRDYGL